SSGLNAFGPQDLLDVDNPTDAVNLQGPKSPDGVQYGLVGPNGLDPKHNAALDSNATIRNAVVVVLHNFTGTLTDHSISNVRFQFGTGLSEPHTDGGGGPTFVISGTKFEDHNGDGVRDAGDQGLAGWTIQLFDANGNAVLDENGNAITTTTRADD